MKNRLFIILGNQLFEPSILKQSGCNRVFMAEDFGLCTYEKHHKLKLYLFLTAMREYCKELESHGIAVDYFPLENRKKEESFSQLLLKYLLKSGLSSINIFEIEDKPFEKILFQELDNSKIKLTVHNSPMFLFTRSLLKKSLGEKKLFRMGDFYKISRKNQNILLDSNEKPVGGKWSFDEENRKKIPKSLTIPKLQNVEKSCYHEKIVEIIEKYFSDHPGKLENFWFPVTRTDAENHLEVFLSERISEFGTYEDAMLENKNFLFHSCISPLLNLGLLTPQYVIKRTTEISNKLSIPLNSLEGFLRQIIGWREFIRGIYQKKSEVQETKNFWNHHKSLSKSWYDGSTGIDPLDDCIKTTLSDGYIHHIPRLMILSNLMNLCEVHPRSIYQWFMEMYIDSSEWVMVPNVYGMATYSDGGIMSTKPYTCASSYILRMSNYKKGDWCDIVDGLYWRFLSKNRSFYDKNARLALHTRSLDRMSNDRKETIFNKAELFIKENTESSFN
ncbi:MAG: cryptochrome/photolyase family protein [Paracoccaceae bacterium]